MQYYGSNGNEEKLFIISVFPLFEGTRLDRSAIYNHAYD